MAESLVISIDIGQAKADLAAITAEFEKFAAATDNVNGRAGGAVSKLADAMAKLKPLDSNITTSVQDLGAAMELIKGGNIAAVVAELNKLAKIDASAVAKNIQALSAELANLKIPPGLDAMAATLGNLASAAGNAKTAIGAVAPTLNTVQSAAKTVGVELANAAGYMAGFGMSLGNIIPAMGQLVAGAGGVGGAFTAMVAALGPLGAALAVVGGAVIVFKALASAAEAIVGPVLKATQEYQSFVNVIDVLRGKGAGAKEFAELQKIANSTGQSMEAMTKNFKGFEAAAQAMNMSAAKSQEIFKGVSTGLGVLGVSTQQSEKAWLALTQMMSKGTVQAEELRGQFGDAVPGAVKIFADALGVSTKQLEQMMKAGQLVTADVLPKVAAFMQQKFQGGLATSLEQATAAINLFGNAVNGILIVMGQGDIGGIAQGFASGLNAITAALNSDGLKTFAAILGDLIGLLVGGAMAALGGFLKGIMDVVNVFAYLIQGIGSVIKAITDWMGITSQVSTSLSYFITGIKLAAEAVGILAAVLVIFNAGAIVSAITGWVTGLGLFTAAAGTASVAGGALATVIGLISAPVLLVAAGVAALAAAIYYFKSSADAAGASASGFGSNLNGMVSGADYAAKGLASVNKELKDQPGSVMAAAAAMQSIDQAQKQAAVSSADLKDKIRDNNNALKENTLAERSMERDTKSYIASLQAQKQALQESSQGIKNHAKDLKMSSQAAKEAGQAHSDMGESSVGTARKTENLKRAMQDLDNEIKHVSASEEDRKRRNADFADSLREQSQRYQEMQQRIQEYKVSLTDSQVAEVKQLENWGIAKTEAANLVKQYELLTQSVGDQAKALEAKAAQDEKAAQFFKDQVDKINALIVARKAEMEAQNQSAEVIKAALAPLEAFRNKLGGLEEGFVKSAAQNKIAAEIMRGSNDVMEISKRVTEELSTKFGTKLPDAAKSASDALDVMTKKFGGLNDEMKKGSEGDSWWQKFAKALGLMNETGPAADKAAGGFKKTADASEELGKKSEEAGQKMAALVDGGERAAMGVQVLGNNVPTTTASLQQLGAVIQQVGGTAVASWNSMDMLASETKTMSDVVLANEAAWKQQIQTMKEGQATEWANVAGNKAMNDEIRTQLSIVESAPAKYNTWAQAIERIKTPLGEVIIQSNKLVKTTHDNTAARQADIDSLNQWITSNEASAQGSIKRIAEYEKESAILDRVTASRAANTEAMMKGKAAGDEAVQAQKERVIGYDEEAKAAGRSRFAIVDTIKALEEQKNAIKGGIGAKDEDVAAIDRQIQKYEGLKEASFWIQDAYKAMAKSTKDFIDNEDGSTAATQTHAQALSATKESVAALGTATEATAAKTAAAKTNIDSFTQSFSQEVDGLSKGVGIFDVLGEKGQKLGEVAIDAAGKVRGMSQSLKDSAVDAQALTSGIGPVADATKKAADGMGEFGGATTILKAAGNGIADIWKGIGTSLLGFNVAQVETLAKAKEWVSGGISEGIKAIGDEIKILTGNMEPGSTAAQKYGQMLDQAAAKEQAAGDAALMAAQKTAQAQAARDAMRITTEQMKTILDQAVPSINAFAASTANASVTEREMADQLDKMLTNLPAVTDASTQLAVAEKGIVDGLSGLGQAGNSFDIFAGSVMKAGDATQAFVEKVQNTDGQLEGMKGAIESANGIAGQFIANLQKEASAIDALGNQAQDTAQQLKEMNDQSGGGGGNQDNGGSTLTEYMKEGGVVGQAVQRQSAPMDAFKSAPGFASGTTSTNNMPNRLKGGGKTAILHPNEAVVPLSRGRSIPVQLKGGQQQEQRWEPTDLTPVTHAIRNLSVTTATSLTRLNVGVRMHTKALKDQTQMLTTNNSGGTASGLNPPPKLIDGPSQRRLHGSDPRRAHPLRTNRDMTGDLIPGADVRGGGMAGEGGPNSVTTPKPVVKKTTINVTLNSGRFDNFNMTQDQLARAAQAALDKVKRQNS